MQLGSSTGIPRILMDLTAHFVALMTLILTFQGRVNRQTAGRVVLPVLVVKFMLEVEVLQRQHKVHDGGETQIMLSRNDTLMFLKSVLFLTIIIKVAFFDKDTTCIACDEWLPMRGNGNKSDALSTTLTESMMQCEWCIVCYHYQIERYVEPASASAALFMLADTLVKSER